jgi:hypothetical protein
LHGRIEGLNEDETAKRIKPSFLQVFQQIFIF